MAARVVNSLGGLLAEKLSQIGERRVRFVKISSETACRECFVGTNADMG